MILNLFQSLPLVLFLVHFAMEIDYFSTSVINFAPLVLMQLSVTMPCVNRLKSNLCSNSWYFLWSFLITIV